MNHGDIIREIRTDNNMTQEEFGERIGVSKDAVCKWENNTNGISKSRITKICKEFHVDSGRFYYNKNDIKAVLEHIFTSNKDKHEPIILNGAEEIYNGQLPYYKEKDILMEVMEKHHELSREHGYEIDNKELNDMFDSRNYVMLINKNTKEICAVNDLGRYDIQKASLIIESNFLPFVVGLYTEDRDCTYCKNYGCREICRTCATDNGDRKIRKKLLNNNEQRKVEHSEVEIYKIQYSAERALDLFNNEVKNARKQGTINKKIPLLLLEHLFENAYIAWDINEGKKVYILFYKEYSNLFVVTDSLDNIPSSDIDRIDKFHEEYVVIPPSPELIKALELDLYPSIWQTIRVGDIWLPRPPKKPVEDLKGFKYKALYLHAVKIINISRELNIGNTDEFALLELRVDTYEHLNLLRAPKVVITNEALLIKKSLSVIAKYIMTKIDNYCASMDSESKDVVE